MALAIPLRNFCFGSIADALILVGWLFLSLKLFFSLFLYDFGIIWDLFSLHRMTDPLLGRIFGFCVNSRFLLTLLWLFHPRRLL